MNWWRLTGMWLPGLVALLVVYSEAGPVPALAMAAVGVLGTRHWILSAVTIALTYHYADVGLVGLLVAGFYRLLYADRIGSVLRNRTERHSHLTSRQHRCGPVTYCRHGARDAYRTGDRAMRAGDPRTALGAYLRGLGVHPPDNFCARILRLRAAEAAYATGASRMAALLGADAVADMPDSPFLRHAVVAARGYALCALAERDLGSTEEAVRLLRLAQSVAHRNRSAERAVRLTAVLVRLSLRDATTEDKAKEIVAAEITGQSLTKITSYEAALVTLRWAQTLALRERHELASAMYRYTIAMLEEPSPGVALADDVAWLRRNRHAATVLAHAHLGLVESLPPGDQQTEDMVETGALGVLRVATDLDDPLLAARLWAAVYRRHGNADAQTNGDALFDSTPQFFGGDVLQARWTAVREALARALPGTPVHTIEPAPWLARPDLVAALQQSCAAAVELWTTLASITPSLAPVRDHANRTAAALSRGVRTTHFVVDAETLITGHPEPVVALAVEPPRPEPPVRAPDSDPEPEPESEPAQSLPLQPSRVVPDRIEAADEFTNGFCATTRLAWEHASALGHGYVGVEHLMIAALTDRECAAAVWAAGIAPDEIRATIERVIEPGHVSPARLSTAAEHVLTEAALIAACSGTKLVRPWHVVLAVLAAPASAVTPIIANADVCVDEIAVRLACGATNPQRSPVGVLGPATSSFSQQARIVVNLALHLAAGDGLVRGDHIRAAVTQYALAPTSLRGQARHEDHRGRPSEMPRSAGLDFALRKLEAATTRWSRGVDLMDLVAAADGAEPWAAGHVPSHAATAVLTAACGHAHRDGQSFVGQEHLALGLDGDAVCPPGPKFVFTPRLKQTLDVACAKAGDSPVEPDHLREALAPGGSS